MCQDLLVVYQFKNVPPNFYTTNCNPKLKYVIHNLILLNVYVYLFNVIAETFLHHLHSSITNEVSEKVQYSVENDLPCTFCGAVTALQPLFFKAI